MERDSATLVDLYRAAALALGFTRDMGRDGFFRDLKAQAAVLHELMIIGEAAKRLSHDFRNAHPEIAWRDMAGMRDKLIHAYDAVDLEQVWRTVRADLPELLAFLEPHVAPADRP